MHKDFDGWNEEKKVTHERTNAPLYRGREIRWCRLGTNIGFEQDGAGEDRARPALILKGFSRHVCIVIPLTTSEKRNPYHISLGIVGGRTAFAIISQLRLIDTRRLDQKIMDLDKETFKIIRKAVKDML